MRGLGELTVHDINRMDYNNIISVVKETNRAPGGFATIQEVASATGLKETDHLLEIGTSTGVSAIEFARLTHCSINSIDINERSLKEAKERAEIENVSQYITFSLQNAMALDFEDNLFNVVFCGNVTSLIPDRKAALSEYVRVLKHGGFLAAVPMYYLKDPSELLIKSVRNAIQVDVRVEYRDYWIEFFRSSGLVQKYKKNYKFDYISNEQLEIFINYILSKKHLKELRKDTFMALAKKYREYIYLFRDNLSHMGYSVFLFAKESNNNEPELFTGTEIFD